MVERDRTLYDLVIYGIEGKTYVLNGNTALYPGDIKFSTSNYMDWGGQWAFWNPQYSANGDVSRGILAGRDQLRRASDERTVSAGWHLPVR